MSSHRYPFGWVRALISGGLLMAAFSSHAQVETYPSKAVRVVVPYAPGGALDNLARLISQRMSVRLGHTFVIDNKPGANNVIGMETVVRAPPDGYTLLFAAAPLALIARWV